MFAWMKRRYLPLLVATLMFALMAAVMSEFLMEGDDVLSQIFGDGHDWSMGMLWTWRIGGFVTWPVFMWLMLHPYVDMGRSEHSSALTRTLVVSALYGGGGLWLISGIAHLMAELSETILTLLSPFLAILLLVVPYLYTWGFVAIYGLARDRLERGNEHGWMGRSLGATVLGIYAIGPLIYAAIAIILVPLVAAVEILPEPASEHVGFAMLAIALSTGNFASQWYGFYKVDQWHDEQNAPVMPQTSPVAPVMPQGSPVAPTVPVTSYPDGTVRLPDGRLVTPDGSVYVPQSVPTQPAPASAVGYSSAVPEPPAPEPEQAIPTQQASAPTAPVPPETRYDYGAGGQDDGTTRR